MERKQPIMEILEFTICFYLHFNKEAILKHKVEGQFLEI